MESLASTIEPIIRQVTILVGGIAGLYIILIIIRVYYERKKVKLLKDIKFNLDKMNHHFGVECTHSKTGLIKRVTSKIKNINNKKRDKKQ